MDKNSFNNLKLYIIGTPDKLEKLNNLKDNFSFPIEFLNGFQTFKISPIVDKVMASEKTSFLRSQAPKWILSNFSLVGPGLLLAIEKEGEIAGDIRMVSGWKKQPSVHIWSFSVRKKFQKQNLGTILLTAALMCVKDWAQTVTYSALTTSPALLVYLKAGENTILAVHHFDLGEKNPKLFLEFKIPKNPLDLLKSNKKVFQTFNYHKVSHYSGSKNLLDRMVIPDKAAFWLELEKSIKDYAQNLYLVYSDYNRGMLYLEKK